ncbi:hypothetical protein AB0C27_50990 [Nonomuraea sp. NPDC048882]|uniref:hypothetical protein n=1 Tax=Nonomuraea sp. NPDC048882 TaxID=3154347 RepID=UPI0033D4FB5F
MSFFITARLAGQSDRVAFTEVVLEQALELIGEPMPPLLTVATRDAHLLGALTRAAITCRQRGERLVLVVDGLDEDEGLTTGPHVHSIASMLPLSPPADMRVIVASRPAPPIPTDVPDGHPLRDPAIVRPLSVSPHATVVRQGAEDELKRLLRGTAAEQDLLGLLAAAGGGLSAVDLEELTGLPIWEIEDSLRAVSGRTFTSRAGNWRPEDIVYLLGHEELQQQAVNFLGGRRLGVYRDRLHGWAERYRLQRWPIDAPEYLLRGYYKLLESTGDVARMVMYATDINRHDRMLDIIGGDGAAIAEVALAQEAIASKAEPDLLAMSRLAVHRIRITERNDNIPSNLPAVWAILGRPSRAEALARSITDPARQVRALLAVAREVAANADDRRARIVIVQAERVIPTISEPYQQAHAYAAAACVVAEVADRWQARKLIRQARKLARQLSNPAEQAIVIGAVARATAITGDWRRAKRMALSIQAWSERAQALSAVATEVGKSGYLKYARDMASSISSRPWRAQAFAAISRAASDCGDRHEAADLARKAEMIARSIQNAPVRAWTLVSVAHAMVDAGEREKGMKVLDQVEDLSPSITKPSDREATLVATARVRSASGDPGSAEMIARNIASRQRQAAALAGVASGLAAHGDRRRAEELASEAEVLARTIAGPSSKGKALATLAQAMAAVGDTVQAEAIARFIPESTQRERALTVVTQAVAVAGDLDRAEGIAMSMANLPQQAKALVLIVEVAIASGDFERAKRLAASIPDPTQHRKILTSLARTENRPKKRDGDEGLERPIVDGASTPQVAIQHVHAALAATGVDSAALVAREIKNPYHQALGLTAVAEGATRAGNLTQVENIIGLIDSPQLRARAISDVSQEAVRVGDIHIRRELLRSAISLADAMPTPSQRCGVVKEIACQLSRAGLADRAEGLARSIDDPSLQDQALAAVAAAVAEVGRLDEAQRLALSIQDTTTQAKAIVGVLKHGVNNGDLDVAEGLARLITLSRFQAQALSTVAQAFVRAGDRKRAEEVALSITEPAMRAQALTTMSINLPPDEARSILARALAVGHWQICLPALVRIEPQAARAIAEDLLHATDLSGATAQPS